MTNSKLLINAVKFVFYFVKLCGFEPLWQKYFIHFAKICQKTVTKDLFNQILNKATLKYKVLALCLLINKFRTVLYINTKNYE